MSCMIREDEYVDFGNLVKPIKGARASYYVARITGPDPNYRLRRYFLPQERSKTFDDCENYFCKLYNGIFEVSLKYYDKKTGELLSRERQWIVVLDGDEYEYEDEEMNYQYVLYTASMLALQSQREYMA